MFEIISEYIFEVVAIVLFAALSGTLCFLLLLGLKMFIDEMRGE